MALLALLYGYIFQCLHEREQQRLSFILAVELCVYTFILSLFYLYERYAIDVLLWFGNQ